MAKACGGRPSSRRVGVALVAPPLVTPLRSLPGRLGSLLDFVVAQAASRRTRQRTAAFLEQYLGGFSRLAPADSPVEALDRVGEGWGCGRFRLILTAAALRGPPGG